jgi:hypothetical protein
MCRCISTTRQWRRGRMEMKLHGCLIEMYKRPGSSVTSEKRAGIRWVRCWFVAGGRDKYLSNCRKWNGGSQAHV